MLKDFIKIRHPGCLISESKTIKEKCNVGFKVGDTWYIATISDSYVNMYKIVDIHINLLSDESVIDLMNKNIHTNNNVMITIGSIRMESRPYVNLQNEYTIWCKFPASYEKKVGKFLESIE